MKTGVSNGMVLNVVATAVMTSGVPIILNTVVGVPVADAAIGETVAVAVEGEFELAAVDDTAFAVGEVLYWNATSSKLTKTASGATKIGVASKAKASSTAVGHVKLER